MLRALVVRAVCRMRRQRGSIVGRGWVSQTGISDVPIFKMIDSLIYHLNLKYLR
jgi:hypothetical protein